MVHGRRLQALNIRNLVRWKRAAHGRKKTKDVHRARHEKVDFPGGSDSALPRQEAQVRSLVKELRSHISHSQKKEKAF